MIPNTIYYTQYVGFGFLFLFGTLAYILVARKLKDPFKIYVDTPAQQEQPTQATGTK